MLRNRIVSTYSGMEAYYYFLSTKELKLCSKPRFFLPQEERWWPNSNEHHRPKTQGEIYPIFDRHLKISNKPLLFIQNKYCVEIDPNLIEILKLRGFETISSIDVAIPEIDVLYTSNCLEHIDDDVKGLRYIQNKMAKDGKLAIYVPALPSLFSELDIKVGHFRRYRKAELIEKVQKAGFLVVECYFKDSLGVIASFALKIFGYKNNSVLGKKKCLKFYDACIYPLSRLFDRILLKRIIGKNLFLFALNR